MVEKLDDNKATSRKLQRGNIKEFCCNQSGVIKVDSLAACNLLLTFEP